jgi:Phage tail lysozyme
MSGAQTSGFPNVLFNAPAAYQAAQQYQDNQLLMQQHQQQIGAGETEMAARIASTLIDPTSFPTPEARAAAYPTMLAQARANGYRLPNAPATYPGDDQMRAVARLGTPSAELFKLGVDRSAKGAIAPDGGGGGTAGGTGGVAGTGGDTAPINAAGDSRTRKASEGGPPAAGSPGAAVAQQVHDFWRSKGYSEEQVAGIMAGGPGSESDFTPTAGGDKVNGVPTSIGLYQHHGPRLHNAQGTGLLDRYGPNPTADQQNEYAAWEISPQGPLAKVGEMLKTAKTPGEAAAIWTQYFGVPADKTEIGRRALGAGRFVGRYGGSGTVPGAAPGSPSVQVGGNAPPPPGGTAGAYTGGGFGSVLGSRPAVATQPISPGPQASNINALMGGVQLAQTATPSRYAAPTLAAGPAAGAPEAPSVEAMPEAGWGTGTPGAVGYGGGTFAAPSPAPPAASSAPAAPAAAQQPPAPAPVPTATQPPAADTLPPLPAPTPPAPTNSNGLTPAQQKDINNRRLLPNVSADELQKRVDAYVSANAAAAEKYQADQVAYVREMRERQSAAGTARHQTVEEQRQAETDKRAAQAAADAAEKAARERAAAADPLQGKSDDERMERTLLTIGPKVRAGTKLTPEEEDQYDLMRTRYAEGPLQTVQLPGGGSVLAHVPREVPSRFPPLPGHPDATATKPIPGTEKQPDFAPANAVTSMLDIGEGQRKIMRTLANLEAYPGGVGLLKGSQPNIMANWTDPAGVGLRADIGDVKAHIYHTLSGAAVTAIEEPRLLRFAPQETDNAAALKTKLQRMLELNRETQLDHYRAFGPESGGRRNAAVEDSILASIPQAALDHLKENPKLAKDFDKQYGRGAAKLALQNG